MAAKCPPIPCTDTARLSDDELRRLRYVPRLEEYRSTRHQALRDLIDELLPNVSGSYVARIPSKLRMHVEVVIVNLYHAWGGHGRALPAIGYLRGKDGEYSGSRLSYDTLNEHVIPCLEAAGFVQTHCGQTGSMSARLIATEKLIERFEKIGWYPSAVALSDDFPDVRLRGLKRKRRELRTLDGKPVTVYRIKRGPLIRPSRVRHLAKAIERYAAELKTINARYARTFVGLLVPDVKLRDPNTWSDCDDEDSAGQPDFSRKRVYRVFNNIIPDPAKGREGKTKKKLAKIGTRELDQGGRMAGAFWQSLSEDLRRQLVIGNEPVAELDFSSMEVALAYADAKHKLDDHHKDAYLPPGASLDERKVYKAILLIMLNSNSRKEAVDAALGKDDDCDENRDLSRLGEDEILRRVQQLEAMHRPHIKIYDKKAGMQRMFRESQIAIGVIKKLSERDITCLSVHDSFIVPASACEEAKRTIEAEFVEQTGCKAKVTVDGSLIPAGLTPATADRQEYSEFFTQLALHEQKYARTD